MRVAQSRLSRGSLGGAAGVRGSIPGGRWESVRDLVHPSSAIAALARLVQSRGGEVHFATPVIKVHEDAVETNLRIAARWQGIYLKSTAGQTQVVLHPRERVTLVSAMGGLGMTLSWGLARNTVKSWSDA